MKIGGAVNALIRLLSLLFLFVLTGYWIFISGVVNTAVPQGMVGVVYTATGGYRIIPANMMWSWEKLIPMNLHIYAFDHSFRRVSFTFSGDLPDAAAISAMPQFSYANFHYAMAGGVEYRLSLEGLLWALTNHYLKPDGLAAYYDQMDKEVQTRINMILSASSEAWTAGESPNDELISKLRESFPHLEFSALDIERQELPNLPAYRRGVDFINVEHQLRLEARKLEGQKNIEVTLQQERRLRLLERYGQLLTRYPILVSFFAVDEDKLLPRDLIHSFLPTAEMTQETENQAPIVPLVSPAAENSAPAAPSMNVQPAADTETTTQSDKHDD